MCFETVPNRNARPTSLLREGRRVRQRTLANLTHGPHQARDPAPHAPERNPRRPEDAFRSVRSRPHGQVAAGLGSWRALGLDRLLAAQPCDLRTRPTPLQRQPLDLLGLCLEHTQCHIFENGRWFK